MWPQKEQKKDYFPCMKIIIALLGILFSLLTFAQSEPVPAPLPDTSLAFCRQQKWAKTCLNTLLTYRCSQYFLPSSPREAQRCSLAAQSMIEHLDYRTVQVINDNKIYRFKIIFSSTLRRLIKKHSVQHYLLALAQDLKKVMKTHQSFDLYRYTLAHAKQREVALEWLAILFQDTTFSRVQVTYLEELASQGLLSQEEIRTKENMKDIALMLDPKNLEKHKFQTWLKLYPTLQSNELSSYLNPSFYHFYPMALVASRLKSDPKTARFAFLIPFALNSDYEFQTLDSERWPWKHPAPFKITPNLEWKMRDLYTGLVGSLFGAGREDLTPAFPLFATKFAADPFMTMQNWAYRK